MLKSILVVLAWCQVSMAAKSPNLLVGTVLFEFETKVYMRDICPIMDLQLVQRNGRQFINGSFTFARTLQVLPLKVIIHFEKPDKTCLLALELKPDACDILNGTLKKEALAKSILKEMNKQIKFPQKCPIEKNRTYGLDYFQVNSQQFPLANLKFQAVITLFMADKQRKILDLRVKGATKRFRKFV